MKQFIVLIGMIILGMYMFNVIAGEDEQSISSAMKGIWEAGIETRTYTP